VGILGKERHIAGDFCFHEPMDVGQDGLELLGERAVQGALAAIERACGVNGHAGELILVGALGPEVIVQGFSEPDGAFRVFTGEAASFGGQAVSQAGLSGIDPTDSCHRAAAPAPVDSTTTFLEVRAH
jgi:hypothetical protein